MHSGAIQYLIEPYLKSGGTGIIQKVTDYLIPDFDSTSRIKNTRGHVNPFTA